ncbi:MAG: Vitamin B12 import ATP-binding protein BtuD [Phycisphaerae bacterium]|nr:Vitamin B12 import ATP-binding protein BtuD [Phycisphaerae bacterium]
MSETPRELLRVENLRVQFPVHRGVLGRTVGHVKAVDGVSFSVRTGQTLGLVGESGCGKTTTGRALLRLIPAEGGVRFDDVDVFSLPRGELRAMRRRMQIVFQDPYGSLNPRMTVETILGEPLAIHRLTRTLSERRDRIAELLALVGLPADAAKRYPHEFSGGQRQRIGIARALALKPDFIVCDEPVSALDVSIQSQILNLLDDLQRELRLSYLLIAHNLAVVEHSSDDVAVMYLGRIVEQAEGTELYRNPRHPYTQALLAAAPEPDPEARRGHVPLPGEAPSPIDPPSGCAFHPRCPFAEQRCRMEQPSLRAADGLPAGHVVACHFASRITPGALAAALRADG